MRKPKPVSLNDKEQAELTTMSRSRTLPARQVERARMILLTARGFDDTAIAARLGGTRQRCARWRVRFLTGGVAALRTEKTRTGRKPTIDHKEIIRRTTCESPTQATTWSTRLLARHCQISPASVGRIWNAHGLKPHLSRGFKLSRDAKFVEKLEDIVGLYLNPPENALVFCCDEKSQIQALERTQPGLPLRSGQVRTHTHDYKRHGTTTLFAALNIAVGEVIGSCQPRHRHTHWLKFLQQVDGSVAEGKELHLVIDNYCTHKHRKVLAWVERRNRAHQKSHRCPRLVLHFTPTSASWLNMVERFFRDITQRRLRHGIFRSVPELIAAIEGFLQHHNQSPKPFIWTKKAADILAKVTRAKARLLSLQNQ